MREIKFRGKGIENGEWVYGWVFGDKAKSIIEIDKEYPNEYGVEAYYTSVVIPETVGQYTGLKDKNGKKIYEADVVTNGRKHAVITFEHGCFNATPLDNRDLHVTIYEFNFTHTFEIIGNIHDNPELLEVQE